MEFSNAPQTCERLYDTNISFSVGFLVEKFRLSNVFSTENSEKTAGDCHINS